MYQTKAFEVVIVSPSDVDAERALIREIIGTWNATHSKQTGCVLVPKGWENSVAPELGSGSAQDVINSAIIDDADILIAFFWTRLGTPTETEKSGSVEEITRHIHAGKPAAVYFSKAHIDPDNLDTEEFSRLKAFQKDLLSQGVVHEYYNSSDLKEKIPNHLSQLLRQNSALKAVLDKQYSDPLEASHRVLQVEQPAPTRGSLRELNEFEYKIIKQAGESDEGDIVLSETYGGWDIQVGEKTLDKGNGSGRLFARYKSALKSLDSLGHIEITSTSASYIVARLTGHGWDLAETL